MARVGEAREACARLSGVTRVVVTGGIGSGKSAVTRILAELGATVIDADQLAREVVAAGTSGLEEIVRTFGPDLLGADGELDRPAMGRKVFDDPTARTQLEAIIHPRVRQRSDEIEAALAPGTVVVLDIPLLVETGQADRFDAVIVVDVPVEVQVERLAERGMSEHQVRSRIGAQASREQRLAIADFVIDNTGTLDELRPRVAEVFERLRDQLG
ncbi:MAG: dephospho-CoA kinase [Nocardioidaceae bacterium]